MVRLIDPSRHERRYEIEIGEAAAYALLRRCIEHDLLAIDPPERASLVPDETQSILQLTSGRRTFSLNSWANDPPHAGLLAIIEALQALRQYTQNLAPVYAGPYRHHG
jgi:hypothetical protein